jgi:hypothetical protein
VKVPDPYRMSKAEFVNPPRLRPRAGFRLLYHATRNTNLASIGQHGLLQRHAISPPAGAIWAATDPDGYSQRLPLVVFQVPKDDLYVEYVTAGRKQAVIHRDIEPKDILALDPHIDGTGNRLSFMREGYAEEWYDDFFASSAARVASAHYAGYFNVGDLIFFGKYKNKRGRIVSFDRTEKGNPTVEVEPIPKGRKQNKTFGLFKLWHADTEKRASVSRVASLYMAKEHATPDARKKHLQDHPGADPKKHTFKGPSKGTGTNLADAALAKMKGVKKGLADAVRAAPEETQRFLFNKTHRQKRTRETAEVLKEMAPKAKKSLWEALKSEMGSFPKSGRILSRLAKGGKLEKGDIKTLYSVSVYVAGGIAGAIGGGVAGAVLFGASKALLHSFSLHVGIKACSSLLDQGFLGVEVAETAATAAGAVLPFTTADLPGFGKIFDVIKDVVLASDEDSKDPARKFVDALYDQIVKDMSKGYSDADMRNMLQGKTPA